MFYELGSVGVVLVIVGIIAFILVLFLALNIKMVKQTDKYIIQRLGGYHTTWGVGLHMLVPFIDRVAMVVSLKEQVKDFDPQPVITKDNVTMQIDTVVFYQITDPKLYCYGVENPVSAIENLTATTLRNIIGELDLDETLTSRDIINTRMRSILDEATDPWGIKVNRVELKNIIPPKDIREAMERQMRAEREKREKVLLAEAHKASAILEAEGEKESAILRADAAKEAAILRAQGEAQSIIEINKAKAEGIKLIKEAGADESVIALKSFEALVDVANGQATKLIIPSNMQDLGSVVASIKEIASTTQEAKKK